MLRKFLVSFTFWNNIQKKTYSFLGNFLTSFDIPPFGIVSPSPKWCVCPLLFVRRLSPSLSLEEVVSLSLCHEVLFLYRLGPPLASFLQSFRFFVRAIVLSSVRCIGHFVCNAHFVFSPKVFFFHRLLWFR